MPTSDSEYFLYPKLLPIVSVETVGYFYFIGGEKNESKYL
jgi:hypothetical protein